MENLKNYQIKHANMDVFYSLFNKQKPGEIKTRKFLDSAKIKLGDNFSDDYWRQFKLELIEKQWILKPKPYKKTLTKLRTSELENKQLSLTENQQSFLKPLINNGEKNDFGIIQLEEKYRIAIAVLKSHPDISFRISMTKEIRVDL